MESIIIFICLDTTADLDELVLLPAYGLVSFVLLLVMFHSKDKSHLNEQSSKAPFFSADLNPKKEGPLVFHIATDQRDIKISR